MTNSNGASVSPPQTAAQRLRTLLSTSSKPIICPGVYDGLTARIALSTGFPCLYMTGAGTAASRLGMPDLGMLSMVDMATNAGMIASLDRTVPVIADADTGYGGPLMVAQTVRSYISAGVAGLHLEDQVVTKRCGHLGNKELVDSDIFETRIKAAVLARDETRQTTGGDIVLIARTDALQSYGYDEAVRRLRHAIALGADVAFLEGLTTLDQCRRVCADLAPTPVLLNLVPGGVTPHVSIDEAHAMGFRIVIYPGLALGAVHESVSKAMLELQGTGNVQPSEWQEQRGGIKGVFGVCGLKECMDFDARAGGKAYSSGV